MEVALKTMALAASISHFDIIEVWCDEHELNCDFECKFTHVASAEHQYNPLDFISSSKQVH